MKFFNIQNTHEFYENVLRCEGEIHEIDANGNERDLKAMAGYLIGSGRTEQLNGIAEINLRVQNPADMNSLFAFALGMGRERIFA